MMFKNQCMLSLLILPRLIQKTQYTTNKFKGLTQWSFIPLEPTLIYTTPNFPTLYTKTKMTSSFFTD